MKKPFKKLIGLVCVSPMVSAGCWIVYELNKEQTLEDWLAIGGAFLLVGSMFALFWAGLYLIFDGGEY